MKSYESYFDSEVPWLKDIPSHWSVFKFKYLFSLARRAVEESDKIVTAFRDGEVTLRENRRTSGFTNSVKEIGYQGVRKGDLVVHAMDAFAGAIGVSDSDGKCTPVYSCCIPSDNALSHYYADILRVASQTGFIESLSRGIRERSTEFRWNDLAELSVPVPPLTEQQKISAFLESETTRIDALINEKQNFINLLEEKRQALISHVVTKGLDDNAEMVESGVEWIGDVPRHWCITRLKFITNKIGSGKTPTGGAESYKESGVLFLRSQNIYNEGLRLEDAVFIDDKTHHEMRSSAVKKGDVLLNITGGSIGRTCLVDSDIGEANVNQHVCIIRAKDAVYNEYLSLFMKSKVAGAQVDILQSGAGREGLNFEQIGSFIITLPPKSEAVAIVSELKSNIYKINSLIDECLNSINILKEHRSALISAAVTGKIDVREEV